MTSLNVVFRLKWVGVLLASVLATLFIANCSALIYPAFIDRRLSKL
jgi:hypothetical protein